MGLGSLRSEVSKKLGKANSDIIRNTQNVQFLPTGETMFDLASGGGFPRGRIIETFGQEHSGKSAINQKACSTTIKAGGSAIYIDAEHAIDPTFMYRCYEIKQDGKQFEILQPNYLEEVLDIIDILIKDGSIQVDLIVMDSIAACKPKDLVTAAADKEARLGMHAKMLGLLMEKVKILGAIRGTTFSMVNQLRGTMVASRGEQNQGTGSGFNPMESFTTPGGYAPRFYASLRMRLEYGGSIKMEGLNPLTGEVEEFRVANKIKVINIKNKVAPPFLRGMTAFDFPINNQRGGWNSGRALVDILESTKHISYAGTKMSYAGLHENWSVSGIKRDLARLQFANSPELVRDGALILKGLYDRSMEYNPGGENVSASVLQLKATQEDLADISAAMNEDENAPVEIYADQSREETPDYTGRAESAISPVKIVAPPTVAVQAPTMVKVAMPSAQPAAAAPPRITIGIPKPAAPTENIFSE